MLILLFIFDKILINFFLKIKNQQNKQQKATKLVDNQSHASKGIQRKINNQQLFYKVARKIKLKISPDY